MLESPPKRLNEFFWGGGHAQHNMSAGTGLCEGQQQEAQEQDSLFAPFNVVPALIMHSGFL